MMKKIKDISDKIRNYYNSETKYESLDMYSLMNILITNNIITI